MLVYQTLPMLPTGPMFALLTEITRKGVIWILYRIEILIMTCPFWGKKRNNSVQIEKLDKTDKKERNKTLKGIKKFTKELAITAFPFAPFSSRSLALNVVKTPIRFFQSLAIGLNKARKGERNFGEVFSEKMKKYMANDWGGVISDLYTDLTLEKNKAEGEKITKAISVMPGL